MGTQFQHKIDQLIENGWEIEEKGDGRVVLINRGTGGLVEHAIIFLFTFWSVGFFNLLYILWNYFFNPERQVLRPEYFGESIEDLPSEEEEVAES